MVHLIFNMKEVKPNAFIVGAPKSGKVSLRYWLSQHPDLYVSMTDVNFFSADVEGSQERVKTLKKYLSYFKDGKGKKVVLDQATRYLMSRVAAKKIKEFNPKAKIIINLRNPADLMFSWHNALRRFGFETEPDFYIALEKEADRRKRTKKDFIKNYFYREVADFYPQVKRYFDIFGKENVTVILLDELAKKPERTYYDLLKFLGLKKITPDFSVKNETKTEPRNQAYVLLINSFLVLPGPIRSFLKFIIPPKAVSKFKSRNIKEVKVKDKLDPKIRSEINKSFKKNLQKLEKLIGKDLSAWYN